MAGQSDCLRLGAPPIGAGGIEPPGQSPERRHQDQPLKLQGGGQGRQRSGLDGQVSDQQSAKRFSGSVLC